MIALVEPCLVCHAMQVERGQFGVRVIESPDSASQSAGDPRETRPWQGLVITPRWALSYLPMNSWRRNDAADHGQESV